MTDWSFVKISSNYIHFKSGKARAQAKIYYNVSILGSDEGYTVKQTLCLKEFPSAKAEGTSEGIGLYLTVYLELSPNKDIISV